MVSGFQAANTEPCCPFAMIALSCVHIPVLLVLSSVVGAQGFVRLFLVFACMWLVGLWMGAQ